MANETEERSDEEVVSRLTQTNICYKKSRISTARSRWDLLSKALHQKSTSTDVESKPHSASVRRFESFGLIDLKLSNQAIHDLSIDTSIDTSINTSIDTSITTTTEPQVNKELLDGKWFECRLWEQSIGAFGQTIVDIKLLTERIPIYELLHAKDNTGNVCLWPSEEVLTYYTYKNTNLCSNKTVLELGGGMTCLCSLVTAITVSAKQVILTDGNQRCISNVKTIVEKNRHRLQSRVECRQLVWGQDSDYNDLYNQIDVILCSDCLYFVQSRHLLVDTIYRLLKSTGIAVLLAPTRGSTFNRFVESAKEKFEFEIIENYDQLVYDLNRNFIERTVDCHYSPDLHYPVMIRLRHKINA